MKMTEVHIKQFEDRPDYWEGRYMSTLHTLKTLYEMKVNLDLTKFKELQISDEKKQKHLEAIALEATKYEWEQRAK